MMEIPAVTTSKDGQSDTVDQISRACNFLTDEVVHHIFIHPDQTINQQYYTAVIRCLWENMH